MAERADPAARPPLALIVSPIRSWPADQGNRARLLAMGRLLQERGYSVHLLLSELEGRADPAARAAMARQWDLLRAVPYRHERRQAHAEAWGADDWYDPALDAAIADLCRRWSYDLCLVNYAWYSRAFEALPPEVVRLIDTHDAFGDRHKRLHAAGGTPVWYFTRPEDEALCLDRADAVIALQETEQRWFEELTLRPVRVVGHVAPAAFLPRRLRQGPLRAGYLASGNPSNRQSILALIRHWAADAFLSGSVELHVAGPISVEIAAERHGFLRIHGTVERVESFYAGVDLVVNPNIGGSGLKIKSVEALSFGRPLFATAEGMLGICPVTPPFVSPDVATLVAALSQTLQQALCDDPGLETATRWARETWLGYRGRQLQAFDALLAELRSLGAARRAEAALAAGEIA